MDTRQLEMFKAFLSWVGNPEEAKAALAKWEKVLEELKTQNAVADTLAKANAYALEKEKEANKATGELHEFAETLKEEKRKLDKLTESRKADLAKREADLLAKEQAFEAKEKSLNEQTVEVVNLELSLKAREADVERRELHLASVQADLDAKQAALKSLLG